MGRDTESVERGRILWEASRNGLKQRDDDGDWPRQDNN